MSVDLSWMEDGIHKLRNQGLEWNPPTLEGASQPRCIIDGKEMLMLSSNNYLNLTMHPKVIEATIEATKKYGSGSGSVRAISGTMDIHLEAERLCANFKFSKCYHTSIMHPITSPINCIDCTSYT